MKCECGQECIWYHEVEGWLCIKCDGKDIDKIGKIYVDKLLKGIEENNNGKLNK